MHSGAPATIARLPAAPGVYRFRDARGRVLYLGRATALRSRVASYWSDLRDRGHLAPMVARIARVEAVTCDSVHEAAWLERNLLQKALPPWNRTPGGQETLVYIRLDDRPAAPRLTVEHLRSPPGHLHDFGPYLGGLRARQALSALTRILPLPYAGTRLRGGQLDLARARGLASLDRENLVRGLTAVLQRQPAAVAGARAQLERLRGRAAQALAFELAGRIQTEIQALDWVTCPQRVTTMTAGDYDVCGWSGEVLVRFLIRDGRLCSGLSAGAAGLAPRRPWPPRRRPGLTSPAATPSSPPPWPAAQRDGRSPAGAPACPGDNDPGRGRDARLRRGRQRARRGADPRWP